MTDSIFIRVVAAVIQRGNTCLVAQRPAHKRHGGLWEFPGGKMRDGESTRDAAQRELSEELGVAVASVGDILFSRRDPDSPFVIDFVSVHIAGCPRALEHAQLCWASPADLRTLSLAPADAAFVAEYLNRRGTMDDGRRFSQ